MGMFAPRASHAPTKALPALLLLAAIVGLDARLLASLEAGGGGGGGSRQAPPLQPRVLGAPLGPGYGFLAALLWPNEEGAPELGCGGSLVAPNVVLTAGHCVVDNGTIWEPYPTVMLGWPALNATKPPPNAEVHEVTRVIVHPDYMSGLAAAEAGGTLPPSDMALLVLDAPSALAPVLLPPRDFPLEEHTPVWAAGYSNEGEAFGTLATWFTTYTLTNAQCGKQMQEQGGEERKAAQSGEGADAGYEPPAETLCTAGQGTTEGVCGGDSGGPLLFGEETPYMQLGVLSWGTGPSPCAPGPGEINAWASLLAPTNRDWLDRELAALQSGTSTSS